MKTSSLTALAAVTIALVFSVTSASARDHRRGDYWWQSYSSSDEYSYPGIRWYGDDCGSGYSGYGYERHRGAHHRSGHHRRARHSGRHHRNWRYDSQRNNWR